MYRFIRQKVRLSFLTAMLIPLLLWGCATTPPTRTNDFNSAFVPRIKMGTTTTAQILKWLGEPHYKKTISESEMMWLYSSSRPSADYTVVPFGHRNIGTTGIKKTLWLFISNDIVVNYTYEEKIM